jgi:hypothetical protein
MLFNGFTDKIYENTDQKEETIMTTKNDVFTILLSGRASSYWEVELFSS